MDAKYLKFNTGLQTTALLSGLLGYWKLSEISGSAIDSVNAFNGTIVGTIVQGDPGKINTCYTFSGTPQTVNVSTDTSANILKAANITLNGWMKTTGTGYKCMVSLIDGSLNAGFSLATEGLKMRARLGDGTHFLNIDGIISINTGDWFMVTLTSDGINGKLYINGVQDGPTTAFPYSLGYNTGTSAMFRIGSRGVTPTTYFIGSIDEVSLWNRALSNSEILDLYNSGTGITYPFI